MLYWTKVKTLHYNILYFVRKYWTKLNVFQTSSKRFVETTPICLLRSELCSFLCIMLYYCIDIYSYSSLHPLSNERKSMFKSGDSRAVWTWVLTRKYIKRALHYLHDVIYGTHCGPDWSFCRCFCSQKRCVTVMTFKSTQPTPFCLEKSSVRKWTF